MCTCFSLHQYPTLALPSSPAFRPDNACDFQCTIEHAALFSSQLFPRELLHLTRQGTKHPPCCHSEDRWGSMQVCLFSTQPCLCPYYGLHDNLLLSALQQPLLHHTLHLLFGPCSFPLRGLHLPHCSLDNWSYGTPHGSK